MSFLCQARKSSKTKCSFFKSKGSAGLVSVGRMTGSDSVDTLVLAEVAESQWKERYGRTPTMMVLQDFHPCVEDEVGVTKGERVKLLFLQNDWLFVTTADDRRGFVPRSFCQPCYDDDDDDCDGDDDVFEEPLQQSMNGGHSTRTSGSEIVVSRHNRSSRSECDEKKMLSHDDGKPFVASCGLAEVASSSAAMSNRPGESNRRVTRNHIEARYPDERIQGLVSAPRSQQTANTKVNGISGENLHPSKVTGQQFNVDHVNGDATAQPPHRVMPSVSSRHRLERPPPSYKPTPCYKPPHAAPDISTSHNNNGFIPDILRTHAYEKTNDSSSISHHDKDNTPDPHNASSLGPSQWSRNVPITCIQSDSRKKEGLFVNADDPSLTFKKGYHGRYLTLFAYSGGDENDLCVSRGEFVTLLNTDDPHWAWVLTAGGQEGFIPLNYLCPS